MTWLQMRIALGLACGIAITTGSLVAQDQPPVLLVLDQTAIDHGPPPHLIPSEAANEEIAGVGLRDPIPYFAARVGAFITLPSGDGGNDGWFALRMAPPAWASEPGSDDGLENYLVAGSGLGSPDDDGRRASLLEEVPNVVPVRAASLNLLVGRRVCAVVYSDDVIVAPATSTNLSGVNLGVVAFQVTSVDTTGGDWPPVVVTILDVSGVCAGALTAFAEAAETP